VVPPSAVSDHLEWSAATIRKKISSRLPFYLSRENSSEECCGKAFKSRRGDDSLFEKFSAAIPPDPRTTIAQAASPRRGGALLPFQRLGLRPGQHAALERFDEFLGSGGLSRYEQGRNDPNARASSGMSAYLHFGQVSPVRLAKKALEQSPSEAQAYVEQLVVRRELALNYVLYNPGYLNYESAAPDWARRSLASRRLPARAYSDAELEEARTEDPYWNAAQMELVLSGTIHNYMRMYWGKQLLRWFSNPAEAFSLAVRLNDSYSLDGRDPNGYAGIAWCFGRHDRPWPERQGFGSVRSMMASGLRKKFDADRYAREMDCLYTSRMKETL
jgi:deoxyribodipyrimidine photo-lyase